MQDAQAQLNLLAHMSDQLMWLIVLNSLILLVMVGTLIAVYVSYQRLSATIAAKTAEWEPKLQQLERDLVELKVQVVEQIAATKTGLAKAQALVDKTEAFWDQVAPSLAGMIEEGRILVARVRIGVNEFQEQVIPGLRMVAGVTSAVRDGLGKFRQMQANRAIKGK